MTPQEKKTAKARFFGMHVGQRVKRQRVEQNLLGLGISNSLLHLYLSDDGEVHSDDCQLVLKPLSSITEEDAVEVANIIAENEITGTAVLARIRGQITKEQMNNPKPSWDVKTEIYDKIEDNKDADYWCTVIMLDSDHFVQFYHEDMTIVFHWHGENMPVDNAAHAIDILRSKGYCLPYNGLDPTNEGWAILNEESPLQRPKTAQAGE